MNCEDVVRREIAQEYALGRLDPEQRDQFEEHYFSCSRCFERLGTVQLLREELTRSQQVAQRQTESSRNRWKLGWVLAPVAITILAVVGLLLSTRTSPRAPHDEVENRPIVAPQASRDRSPNYDELASFEPPQYDPIVLRGDGRERSQRFADAMRLYQKRDFQGALALLRLEARNGRRSEETLFFLGISELLVGDVSSGIDSLRRTAALGDTPFLEEAHYYLAKAHLRNRDFANAERELKTVIRMRGDLEHSATALLKQIPAVERSGR